MLLSRLFAGLALLLTTSAGFAQESKSDDQPPAPQREAAGADKDSTSPDKPADEKPKAEPPSAEELKQWIKDLVHPKFATRQAASQKLVQAGVPGMQAAAEAAKTDDLELATRCLAVLTEGLASKAESVQKSARGSLETLAKSDNISVAQRARQALDTPVADTPFGVPRPGFAMQQVRMQVKNGVRELSVIQDGKESIITDTNGKDITITVTETVNGQKKTQTYKAKDEEDLKKTHPEIYGLYARFAGGRAVRIQVGGNFIGGNPFLPVRPQPPRPRRVVNPFKAAELLGEVDKLREKLEGLNERLLKSAEADKADSAELKRIAEELKSTTQRLNEIKVESQLP